MPVKFVAIVALMLLPATAGCERRAKMLAEICRGSARIDVQDTAQWSSYLKKVRATVSENRKLAAKNWMAEQNIPQPSGKIYLIPFPYVEGYEIVWQHPRFSNMPAAGDTPGPNDQDIMRAGKRIARIRDFDVRLPHFGYTDTASCTRDHPEDYDLR